MSSWRSILFAPVDRGDGMMMRSLPSKFSSGLILPSPRRCCADGTAACATVADIGVNGVVLQLFQGQRFPEQYVSDIVPPSCFRLLFPLRKKLDLAFLLHSGLRLHAWYNMNF